VSGKYILPEDAAEPESKDPCGTSHQRAPYRKHLAANGEPNAFEKSGHHNRCGHLPEKSARSFDCARVSRLE
jgi:hypothetical protein